MSRRRGKWAIRYSQTVEDGNLNYGKSDESIKNNSGEILFLFEATIDFFLKYEVDETHRYS